MAQVRAQQLLFYAMFIIPLHAAEQSASLTSSLNKEEANDLVLQSEKKHET
jgi:hypothetical protein